MTAQSAYQLEGSFYDYNAFEIFVENDIAVEKVSWKLKIFVIFSFLEITMNMILFRLK